MREKIVLIGGGGHCKSVIDVVEQENKYEIIGIIDTKENIGKRVLGYQVIGCDDDLSEVFKICKNAGSILPSTANLTLYMVLLVHFMF